MAESESLQALEKLYQCLDLNFNALFEACKTEEDRDRLRRDYVNARDNFWEARNRVFHENDPLIASLNAELKETQKSLEKSLADLKKISQILGIISQAVGLASRLITLGSV